MNRYVGAGIRDSGTELPPDFEAFRAEALACGCDEALVRVWQPDTVLETHTHPFDAEAIVVQGEMWLSEGDRTRHLTRGGTFRLRAGTPHAERYGAQGATFWVGRRQIPS
jgi:hypothetical protein